MEMNNEQVKNVWKPLCIVFAALLALSWVFFGFLCGKGGVNLSVLERPEKGYAAKDSLLIGESLGNGITVKSTKLSAAEYAEYNVSAQAETAYTLTATITPANATDKTVDWTVKFANPSSAWAAGKTATDYVGVVPNTATTAIAACTEPFGEQIVITVTSRDNSAVYAECTVDYVSRMTDLTVELYKGGYDGTLVSSSNGDTPLVIPFDDTESLNILLTPQLSAGTMEDAFTYTGKFDLSELGIAVVSAIDFSDYGEVTDTYELFNFSNGRGHFNGGYHIMNHFIPEGKEDNYGFVPTPQNLKQQVYTLLALMYEDPIGTFTFTATGEYSSIEKTVNLNYDADTVKISVTDVALDKPGLVF